MLEKVLRSSMLLLKSTCDLAVMSDTTLPRAYGDRQLAEAHDAVGAVSCTKCLQGSSPCSAYQTAPYTVPIRQHQPF